MRLKNPCIQSAISYCDELKNESQKFQIRLSFYFNMRNKIQINDMYFHLKTGFYFEYVMFSFVFIFKKKKKKMENEIHFVFRFGFHKGIEKRITKTD